MKEIVFKAAGFGVSALQKLKPFREWFKGFTFFKGETFKTQHQRQRREMFGVPGMLLILEVRGRPQVLKEP
jgi:hypothetical protein